MYDVVVKKFTFAVSSRDELLVLFYVTMFVHNAFMQHLGVNYGGIWKFELGFFKLFFVFFLLKKSGLIFVSPVATLQCLLCSSLRHVVDRHKAWRAMPLFVGLNPLACNASKHLSY